jgi:hypothetical protein
MGQLDRHALNQTFWDLGLRFQWDEATWATLATLPDLRAQLRHYLEKHQPHLLAVYDVDFLGALIERQLGAPRSAMGMEAHRSV